MTRTILIIEDDQAIRETLKMFLEIEGYMVCAAANGQEAIALLKRISNPCLILLDLMMPVMDGWDFLKAQKRDITIAPIPVVVVSAVADRVKSVGATGMLKKPIDLECLLKTVKQYCG